MIHVPPPLPRSPARSLYPTADVRVRFLGTGTSHGIPVIGCACPVCTSPHPHNRRLRSSILIETGERRVVVDTTPEFRLQALAAGLQTLDAVLFTHAHADHIFGLDDVRIFNWRTKQPMPIYGSPDTLATVRRSFGYVFEDGPEGGGKPKLDVIPVTGPFEVAGLHVTPLEVLHGQLAVTAFRVRERPGGAEFAYATDCNYIAPETLAQLQGLDLLILDALGKNRHPTHFSLEQAIEVARELAPRRTLFTHISHGLEHEETNATLPDGMSLAHDGLVVEL
ncbi:MAG: Metal-dependent hydrolases of the beta-lactamase superfamily I; PhnP protein [uncultured Chloroflexi bacterium]|uniref:Metal-dependent hydrolases of the beta-lactamase superfamily I PhnP protein n=1 Tax=uncultured Chloroflexota bacterium TaxID=166587 RepID=A0A6J4JS61_9CHLR|nr:MAG: Metal-dependent hydrolases of the beta-lactamase superfamily I; PhnP protein [uncultured Chloroflexota bacterium]